MKPKNRTTARFAEELAGVGRRAFVTLSETPPLGSCEDLLLRVV